MTVDITLADLNPYLEWTLTRKDVPEVPVNARRREDDYGHHDIIFDYEEQRWRFRKGQLMRYIVYGGKPRRPIAIWEDDRIANG